MRHPYSVHDATRIWRELHGDRGPFGDQRPPSQRPASDLRESPRVSVYFPFFEHQHYLETLVAAFKDQSDPDLEVVVVNDGSGPEVSQEFDRVANRTRDGRLRFLTTENRGPSAPAAPRGGVALGTAEEEMTFLLHKWVVNYSSRREPSRPSHSNGHGSSTASRSTAST
jgi:cellulose synthase/poly-beta-1,6-N-acetylglucosamine synthase-like glycosyltransferase